jgi:protease-4
MRAATGAVREEVRFGGGQQSSGDDFSDVLRAIAGESLGGAPVALVRASGAISMEGGSGPLSDSGGIVERRMVRTLQRLEKDDSIKAVVLRIDSPGGSALASDLIWRALMRIRAKKPLVVSVGGMAASGGYYLASSGTVVYADEASILGSIGVVSGKIAADRALGKIGVHAETIPAKTGDSRAAARAGYESLLEPWDDATRARLLATMTGIYELFLARVAEGRGIPTERVAASAEGRIFSGSDAKTRGLVDELGGLADAIARARKMAGLPDDARVAAVSDAPGFLEAFADDAPRAHAHPGSLLAQAAPEAVRELAPFTASLAPILSQEPVLCAVPFALTVR